MIIRVAYIKNYLLILVIALVFQSVSYAEKAPKLRKDLSAQEIATIEYGKVPLGLPKLSIPKNNALTKDKVVLGRRLFEDTRFSADGKVACVTCHNDKKGFTDNLKVSKGFRGLTGTRNAQTIINAAYMHTMFWDGREPTLEKQSLQPPVNPVEGGLVNHDKIIEVIKKDKIYRTYFKKVFGISADKITMDEVSKAIASFERVVLGANSKFDRYYFGGDKSALGEKQVRGLDIFLNKGRCVSCHTIEQDHALFTNNRFHNIGVGFKKIRDKEERVASIFIQGKQDGNDIDVTVLSSPLASELGRFAVTEKLSDIGAFKTPTIRDISKTAPYMHDGSLKTLMEVVDFYNNGGRLKERDPLSDHLSGGIKPLDLTPQEKKDLVAFMESLDSESE